MRRALTLLAALALGAAPLQAGATTAPTLTLTQQARKAGVIVRATLGASTRVTEGDVTWVVYPLTVAETVVGDPATLPQREGQPALYVLAGLEGVPDFRTGQEGFFLLYAGRLDSPLVGFSQGFYPIVNGQVTRPGATAADPAAAGTATATPPAAATGAATTPATPGATGTPPATTTPTAPGTPATTAPAAAGTTTPGTAGTTSPTGTTPTTPPATTGTPGGTPAATTAPADPNAFPTDPAAFRDALRAARGGQ